MPYPIPNGRSVRITCDMAMLRQLSEALSLGWICRSSSGVSAVQGRSRPEPQPGQAK
jgi:hypothetical protein